MRAATQTWSCFEFIRSSFSMWKSLAKRSSMDQKQPKLTKHMLVINRQTGLMYRIVNPNRFGNLVADLVDDKLNSTGERAVFDRSLAEPKQKAANESGK